VGEVRGSDILDANLNKAGEVRGDDILDANWQKVAEVRGDQILDGSWQPIGSLSDARRRIDGAHGGATVAALWYFFIR